MALLLATGCMLPTDVRAQDAHSIPDVVETIKQSAADDAFWSIIVRDTTGSVLAGYNHDKLIRPASNLKLLTSALILD